MHKSASITYFEQEGRENLPQVLRGVKRALRKRAELREMKLVIFTATGEGPALAYGQMHEFDPQIIAVTFPPEFFVRRGSEHFHPRISEKLNGFFRGVGIRVLTSRLPFDLMDGLDAHNDQMRLIKNILSIFGGGFALIVQAVLSACDHGEVRQGEKVIAISGDTAAVITACNSQKFLSKTDGLVVNEILCKPRNLTISRARQVEKQAESTVAPKRTENKILDLKPLPKPHLLDE